MGGKKLRRGRVYSFGFRFESMQLHLPPYSGFGGPRYRGHHGVNHKFSWSPHSGVPSDNGINLSVQSTGINAVNLVVALDTFNFTFVSTVEIESERDVSR